MIDVIGKKLIIAQNIIETEGFKVIVKEAISDKQKESDSLIVIRQKLSDNIVELTVSNFKLEI